ncbi:hypothetical protein [Kocuria sp. NPDC057446]|uniref:hypothetical protein n=1 Tax=Kocuria sp. NPDC057446 TaxID=3346137 RepID=UPI00367ECAA2
MTGDALPETPTAEDLRALARSSPWRFSTVHFTHRRQRDGGSTASGAPVEAWLDRRRGRLVLRSAGGVEVAGGPPYGEAVDPVPHDDDAARAGRPPSSPAPEVVLRPDGLVVHRPEDWYDDHGPEGPTLTDGSLPTVHSVHLDVRPGIVVDITPLDGTGGSGLSNEILAVDEPLDPPLGPLTGPPLDPSL